MVMMNGKSIDISMTLILEILFEAIIDIAVEVLNMKN